MEEQTALAVSSYPHMDETGQGKLTRYYERLGDYLFDTTPDTESGIERLKEIQH